MDTDRYSCPGPAAVDVCSHVFLTLTTRHWNLFRRMERDANWAAFRGQRAVWNCDPTEAVDAITLFAETNSLGLELPPPAWPTAPGIASPADVRRPAAWYVSDLHAGLSMASNEPMNHVPGRFGDSPGTKATARAEGPRSSRARPRHRTSLTSAAQSSWMMATHARKGGRGPGAPRCAAQRSVKTARGKITRRHQDSTAGAADVLACASENDKVKRHSQHLLVKNPLRFATLPLK